MAHSLFYFRLKTKKLKPNFTHETLESFEDNFRVIFRYGIRSVQVSQARGGGELHLERFVATDQVDDEVWDRLPIVGRAHNDGRNALVAAISSFEE